MKKYIVFIVAFLVVGIFAKSVIFSHQNIIPSDALVGLYHPFIDTSAQSFPRGVPFKNPLITDPVRQQIPWKHFVIDQLMQHQLPLWNPYNGLGMPLLANFQSGTFYPLHMLFLLLPFVPAWNIYILLQPVLGICFMYLYLRSLKVSLMGSLLGGIVFAFCGFSVSWMTWGNVGHTLLWLPLILFVKEKLLVKWQWRYVALLVFAELSALFAGHLQVWFYTLVVSNVYLFVRIVQKIYAVHFDFAQGIKKFLVMYYPFLITGICIVILGLVQLFPTFQFIQLSARDMDQQFLGQVGWFLPWQNLMQFLAPDYFGNPATGNYWGVWNYGEFVGYVGILPLVLSFCAMTWGIIKRDWRVLFFTSMVGFGLIFALPTPLAYLPFIAKIPFLSSAQPTRLMALIDFSLAILAGIGIDALAKLTKKQMMIIAGFSVLLLISMWISVFGLRFFQIEPEHILVAKRNILFPTILAVVSLGSLVGFFVCKKQMIRSAILVLFLVITVFDLVRFADKFTPFTSQAYFYPQSKVLTFLQKNTGNYRVLPIDDRILAPNENMMYKIPSLTNYDPLYPLRFAQLMVLMERKKPDLTPPFGFNRIITPKNYTSPLLDVLGVKYILSLEPLTDTRFSLVAQEGETRVYENTHVLARTFFATQVVSAQSVQNAAEHVFALQDTLKHTAVVEGHPDASYATGSATIISYQPNKVVIHTQNTADGFLVLTDTYYPTWKATIDGKATLIYPVDITLRGIDVPRGEHTVIFSDSL